MKHSNSVVLDTSAIVRIYVPDGPIPEELIDLIESAEKGETELLSPELLSAEFYQVLLKKENKGFLQSKEVDQICNSFKNLPILFIAHAPLMTNALKIARQYNITIYDSLFLSLAKKSNSRIITADALMKKVAVECLS